MICGRDDDVGVLEVIEEGVEECESGDWLICMRRFGVEDGVCSSASDDGSSRGVLNAPVLWRCRRSKSSCSSLGRRGGAGPFLKGDWEAWGREVVRERRESGRGRRRIARRIVVDGIVACWLKFGL